MDESGSGEVVYLDLKKLLRTLGDVARLQMVHVLARTKEMSVTDLGELILVNGHRISQPLVSWHLSMLRRQGLVRTRRDGRLVYCSLDRARYQQCLRLLREIGGEAPTPAAATQADPAAGIGGLAHS